MRLRSRNPKATVVGTAGSVLSGIWGAYAIFATASQLPTDASKLGSFLANPPTWLPWGIFALSVLVLAWSLWPTDEEDDGGLENSQATHGPQSPIINTVHGGVHYASPPIAPEPPPKSAFAIREALIRSSPVATEAGDLVPDLWCVGMFLRIGNAQTNARTLRDVSAEIGWLVKGPIQLAFEGGQTRVNIRSGETFLLQVGHTMSSEPVGLPFGDRVPMDDAKVEAEKDKLARDVATFFAGAPSSPQPRSLELQPNAPPEGMPFKLTLHGEDVLSVDVPILVDVSWAARLMPQLMLRPNEVEG